MSRTHTLQIPVAASLPLLQQPGVAGLRIVLSSHLCLRSILI